MPKSFTILNHMITINLTNDHIGEIFFPVRETDVVFLNTYAEEAVPKDSGIIFGLFKKKLKPYEPENAEWFFEYADKAFEAFLNFFKMDKALLQKHFLMGCLFRDRALQRIFNRKYPSKESFITDLDHKLSSYRYPDERTDLNPLPVCMTANLFTTIYFTISSNGTMKVPDEFLPYILPVGKEDKQGEPRYEETPTYPN